MASYSVTVDGEIRTGGDIESGDSVSSDGTSASGTVGADVDRYIYSGEVDSLSTDGRVLVEGREVAPSELLDFYEYGPEKHLVMDHPDGSASYEFTVNGIVNGGDESEVGGDDAITSNADGTVTVDGSVGSSYTDDYYVRGEFVDFTLEDEAGWTLTFDGQSVTVTDLLRYDSPTMPANEVPVPSISTTVDGLTVYMDGSGSSDPDGMIQSYTWTVDGSVYTGKTASHTFQSGGSYTAELTVTDDDGDTSTATKTVSVNEAPLASFEMVDQTRVSGGVAVTLDGGLSSDPDGTVQTYEWQFPSTTYTRDTPEIQHTFPDEGTYSVTLTVTDDGGATDSVTKQITATTPPEAVVTHDGGEETVTITFDGSGSSDVSGSIQTYEWTINGQTYTGSVVSITTAEPGTYTAELTVTDDEGQTDTTSTVVEVVEQTTTELKVQ